MVSHNGHLWTLFFLKLQGIAYVRLYLSSLVTVWVLDAVDSRSLITYGLGGCDEKRIMFPAFCLFVLLLCQNGRGMLKYTNTTGRAINDAEALKTS